MTDAPRCGTYARARAGVYRVGVPISHVRLMRNLRRRARRIRPEMLVFLA